MNNPSLNRVDSFIKFDDEDFHLVLGKSIDSIFILDNRLNFLFVNQVARDYFELPEQIIGCSIFDFQLRPLSRIIEVFNEKELDSINSKFWFKNSKGKKIFFDSVIYKAITKGKHYLVFNGRDTTKIKKFAIRIIENNKKLKALSVYSREWDYFICDDEITYISDTCKNVTGFTKDDFRKNKKLIDEIVYFEDVHTYQANKKLRSLCDGAFKTQFRIVTKEKKVKWIEQISNTFYDKEQTCTFVTNIDITKHVDSYRLLKASEESYKNLFEDYPLPCLVFDYNTQIIYDVNLQGQKFIGTSFDEIIGKPVTNYFVPGDISKITLFLAENFGKDDYKIDVNKIEAGIITNKGNTIPSELTFYKTIYKSKDSILCVLRDLTQQIKREEELKRALDKADESSRIKSKFLTDISHELRTPLNGIIGFLQVLENETEISEKQQEYFDIIKENSFHLKNLVDDIVDNAGIESSAFTAKYEIFSLLDLINSLKKTFEIKAAQIGFGFTSIVNDDLPKTVWGDQTSLKRLLFNLLTIAVEFIRKEEITLRIGYHDQKVRFQIEVPGLSIPDKYKDEIFRPFKKINLDGKKLSPGLSLNAAKNLAEKLNSELKFISSIEKGSKFWFDINLPESENDDLNIDNLKITGYEGERKTLLLVDDDFGNRKLLSKAFEPLGFEIIECEDAKEGIEILESRKIDLVFMDRKLPGISGIEATRIIKENPVTKEIPVIIVSANRVEEHVFEAFNAGCDDYIVKPIQVYDVAEEFEELLGIKWIKTEKNKSVDDKFTRIIVDYPEKIVIEKLYNYIKLGDVTKIEGELERLSSIDVENIDFYRKCRGYLKKYQIKLLKDFVSNYYEGRK